MRKWIYKLFADQRHLDNWHVVFADNVEEAIERSEREWKDTPFTVVQNSFLMVIRMEKGVPVGDVIY